MFGLTRIIPRYVFGELLRVFLMALACMTGLVLLFGIAREALREGLGGAQVLRLVPYLLPDALRFTIPGTVLFAVSVVYGRIAGTNELLALKSLGINPLTVLVPAYVLSFVLSLVTVLLSDIAVSWGRSGVRRVVLEAIEQIAYSRLQLNRSYSTPAFSINVKDVQGKKLIRPVISIYDRKRKKNITINSRYAELDSDGKVLIFRCYDGRVDVQGELSYRFPDVMEREIPLEQFKSVGGTVSPSWLSLRQVRVELVKVQQDIRELEDELALKGVTQLLAMDLGALFSKEWKTNYRERDNLYFLYHRLRTEPPRRWAGGFSCFCFALVGSGVAIRRRNATVMGSFFLCFLPVLLVYYPLLAFGVQQAKNGTLPPYVVWLGNVVMLAAGLWILRKVLRY